MGCGAAIMRTILIIFNVLFLLAGIAGLAGGIWLAVDPSKLFTFIQFTLQGEGHFVRKAAYVFIGASCLVILVAALGCFGACLRNRCALGTYSAFMLILLVIQITSIVLVIVFDQKFNAKDKAANTFQAAVAKATQAQVEQAVDKIQTDFKCCGVAGPGDYVIAGKNKPASCGTYQDGCYDEIRSWIVKNLGLVIGVTVAIIVFQIILFIFAICLCRHSDFEKVV